MSQLLIASNNAALGYASAQVAHDLRNLLATVGLHLETLQRLSGPSGTKAADAAHALLTRGAALCNKALDCTANTDNRARRRGVDLIQIARHVADLLLPSVPKDFSLDICPDAGVSVFADPDEVFRILFNLMSNAVAVANRKASSLTSLTLHISKEDSTVTIRVADDGPGLPAAVRARLFGTQERRSAATRHGYGLAIARELAERNGGTLTLVSGGKGTTFALKLPVFLSVVARRRRNGWAVERQPRDSIGRLNRPRGEPNLCLLAARFEARVILAPHGCRSPQVTSGTISKNLRSRLRESSTASPLVAKQKAGHSA